MSLVVRKRKQFCPDVNLRGPAEPTFSQTLVNEKKYLDRRRCPFVPTPFADDSGLAQPTTLLVCQSVVNPQLSRLNILRCTQKKRAAATPRSPNPAHQRGPFSDERFRGACAGCATHMHNSSRLSTCVNPQLSRLDILPKVDC